MKARRFGVALIAIALLSAQRSTTARAETESIDLKALAKKARPAVMLLVVSDAAGKEIATGTGFLVSSDGKLITNHHVVENGASAIAKAENGGLFPVEGVLADDPKNDLVLLKLKGKDLPFLPLSNSDKIEVGTRIAVIGSPVGLEGTLSEGIVSAVRSFPGDQRRVQITAAISPGSSGSPVLDPEGKVLGVAVSQIGQGQSLNFAIPEEVVRKVMANVDESTKLRPLLTLALSADEADTRIHTSPEGRTVTDAQTKQDWVAMLEAAQTLVRRYPESPYAYLQLGHAYWSLGFSDDAIAAYHQAIKLRPEYAEAWYDLGWCYSAKMRHAKALAPLQQAVKLKPDFALAWSELALCYIQLRQTDNARAAISRLQHLDPQLGKDMADLLARQPR